MVSFLNNLHPLLKRKKDKNIQDDPSFALIDTIERELIALESEAIKSKGQSFLASASGDYLDNFGSWFNVVRKPNEVDTNYRKRILGNVTRRKGTIPGIEEAIREHLRVPGVVPTITEPLKNIFFLSSSKLNSKDRLMGEYYRFGTLELNLKVDYSAPHTNLLKVPENNIVFSPNNVGLGTSKYIGGGEYEVTPDEGKVTSLYYFLKHDLLPERLSEPLKERVTYTISMDIKTEVDTTITYGISSAYIDTPRITIPTKANEYRRISYTFRWLNSEALPYVPITFSTGKGTEGLKTRYKNLKIEYGEEASEYSKNPRLYLEDTQDEDIINNLKTVIDEYKPTGTEVYYKGVKI